MISRAAPDLRHSSRLELVDLAVDGLRLAGCGRRLAPYLLLLAPLLPGCQDSSSSRVVTAEFQDEKIPNGLPEHEESVLVTLSEPLPSDFDGNTVRVKSYPEASTSWKVEPTPHPRKLRLSIQTRPPEWQLEGVYGVDPSASGLALDFGSGWQWTDIQAKASLPVLKEIVWIDSPPGAGNLAVDQGDWLRLTFDRPVQLAPGASGAPVTPEDIILSKANDRLDDGEQPAHFEVGERPEEVLIVLGSRPILSVGGELTGEIGTIDRFLPSAPSGLALNGSSVFPLARITDARGGAGSISTRELDIEFPPDFSLPHRLASGSREPPQGRTEHTITPLGWLALLAGGRTSDPQSPAPLDEVLLFDPFQARAGKPSFTSANSRLPGPVFRHTATPLPGDDGLLGTQDDLVVIIGGEDGTRATGRMAAARLRRSGALEQVEVVVLEEELRVPRSAHAAVAISPTQILVDGGFRPSEDQLVETAEVLAFYEEADGIRVEHQSVFRTLARMHHSLTLLPSTNRGVPYVLAYGGFGRDRRRYPHPSDWFGRPTDRAEASGAHFPYFLGAVLVSPVLIDLRNPTRSVTTLPYDFSFSLLRTRHTATPLLEPGAHATPGLPTSNDVLLAGGTSSHPRHGFDGGLKLWEMPIRVDLPQGHETADAVLVRFDSTNPAQTRLEVLPYPAPDPDNVPERVAFSATAVPGYGVLLAGGGPAERGQVKPNQRSIDVFLSTRRRLTGLAGALPEPMAGHGGYFVEHEGIRSLFLLGGISEPAREALSVVEVPLGKSP